MTAADGTTASPGPPGRDADHATVRRAWYAFAAMAVPLLALSMDVNGAGMLLPSIQDELDPRPGAIAWVVSATALTIGALLLPVGRLAPRLGDRRLVLWGLGGFGLMSLVCGLAPTFGVLVAARVGQGLGGVLAFTTSLAVINRAFPADRRAAAVGAWGVVNGVGGALGPIVAGAVTSAWSWRAFFLLNAPLCLAALPAVRAFAPADPPPPPRVPVPWLRLAAVSVAVVALTVGCQATTNAGWLAPVPIGALSLSGALAAWLWWGSRHCATPVISAGVRAGRSTRTASLVGTSANWGFGVTIAFMGLYLQQVRGLSPFASGVVFTSFSAAMALAGLVIARLTRRVGLRRAMALSLVVVALPLLTATGLDAGTGLLAIVVGLAVTGFGQGLAFDLSTLAALDGVPGAEAAEASGLLATVRSMGLTVGIAVSTSLAVRVTAGDTDPTTGGIDLALVLSAAVALAGLALVPLARRRDDRG